MIYCYKCTSEISFSTIHSTNFNTDFGPLVFLFSRMIGTNKWVIFGSEFNFIENTPIACLPQWGATTSKQTIKNKNSFWMRRLHSYIFLQESADASSRWIGSTCLLHPGCDLSKRTWSRMFKPSQIICLITTNSNLPTLPNWRAQLVLFNSWPR